MLTIVISLWACAGVCWLIGFLFSVIPPGPESRPISAALRSWNWVALGLCFVAATHIWWK